LMCHQKDLWDGQMPQPYVLLHRQILTPTWMQNRTIAKTLQLNRHFLLSPSFLSNILRIYGKQPTLMRSQLFVVCLQLLSISSSELASTQDTPR
jgi:hypothetical protein